MPLNEKPLVTPAQLVDGDWCAANFTNQGDHLIALEVLRRLDGLTVGQVRQVLRCAEGLLDATARHDVSAIDFRQAAQGYRHAFARAEAALDAKSLAATNNHLDEDFMRRLKEGGHLEFARASM